MLRAGWRARQERARRRTASLDLPSRPEAPAAARRVVSVTFAFTLAAQKQAAGAGDPGGAQLPAQRELGESRIVPDQLAQRVDSLEPDLERHAGERLTHIEA